MRCGPARPGEIMARHRGVEHGRAQVRHHLQTTVPHAADAALQATAHHLQTTVPHAANAVMQATAHHLQTTVPHAADAALQATLEVSDIALASAVNHATGNQKS